MADPSQLPPAAILIHYPVADFDTWKAGFDANEDMRREAGILAHHINRAENDPNDVTLFVAVSDVDKAKALLESDELRQVMQDLGVQSPPEITWMTPAREAAVWDRELPAFMLSHRVADFDRWLKGYDGAAEFRQSNGIVGHAANRSMDDPSVAVVYHQAESFDDLRSFLAHPELKAVMEKAGVISEPEVTFVTGGWAKRYD
jgi:quinol monooxygenase YgiN